MPFDFSILCDLLNELDLNRARKSSKTRNDLSSSPEIVVSWFNKHNAIILRKGQGAVAFLSCLFPERREDRVFDLWEIASNQSSSKPKGLVPHV